MWRGLLRNIRKILRRAGLTRWWGQLAIAQLAAIGLLYLTLPAVPPASDAPTSDPVTLTMVVPSEEKVYWDEVIDEFEDRQDEIRIDLIDLAELTPERDVTWALRESCTDRPDGPCDILYLDVIWVPELAENGKLLSLSDKVSAEYASEFLDSEIAVGTYEGALYRLPFRADFGMLYYRRDLLRQAGEDPPETFDELLEMAERLKRENNVPWGYLWQTEGEGLAASFFEVLQGHGGYWIDPETGAVGLDQPEGIEAVKFLLKTIETGISPPLAEGYLDEDAGEVFQDGEAVFMRNWPFVIDPPGDSLSPRQLDLDIERIPMALHAEGHTGASCRGSWGLGISNQSQHPDQAWEAIEYLTRRQTQRLFDRRYIPSRRDVIGDTPAIAAAAQTAVSRPQIPNYARASRILQEHLSEVLQGAEPGAEMRAAAMETRRLLESG